MLRLKFHGNRAIFLPRGLCHIVKEKFVLPRVNKSNAKPAIFQGQNDNKLQFEQTVVLDDSEMARLNNDIRSCFKTGQSGVAWERLTESITIWTRLEKPTTNEQRTMKSSFQLSLLTAAANKDHESSFRILNAYENLPRRNWLTLHWEELIEKVILDEF